MLAITSHGNAPYLMAARVARALQNRPVVLPLYYGETQKRILREEIQTNHDRIFLSSALGELLAPLLLDVKNGTSFAVFAHNLADPKNPQGVMAIENRLNDFLKSGIPAEALDGSTSRIFKKEDFAGVLISALPVRVNLPHKYFFFTALLSRLYGTAPSEYARLHNNNCSGTAEDVCSTLAGNGSGLRHPFCSAHPRVLLPRRSFARM